MAHPDRLGTKVGHFREIRKYPSNQMILITPPKSNIEPEKWWFPIVISFSRESIFRFHVCVFVGVNITCRPNSRGWSFFGFRSSIMRIEGYPPNATPPGNEARLNKALWRDHGGYNSPLIWSQHQCTRDSKNLYMWLHRSHSWDFCHICLGWISSSPRPFATL